MNRDELIAKYGGTPEKAAKAVADGTASNQIASGDFERWEPAFQNLVILSRSGELVVKAMS
jgi:hypothetical protein